jgi:hypothetical protein
MLISGSFISGVMLGIEFLLSDKAVVFDLLIVRIIIAIVDEE